MRGILAWLLATLVVYLAGGYYLGTQLRTGVAQYQERTIIAPITHVTEVLRR